MTRWLYTLHALSILRSNVHNAGRNTPQSVPISVGVPIRVLTQCNL